VECTDEINVKVNLLNFEVKKNKRIKVSFGLPDRILGNGILLMEYYSIME
jgi:hypothetical protein